MHPILKQIATELNETEAGPGFRYRFALACIEDVAPNLEEDSAIGALAKFRELVASFDRQRLDEIKAMAAELKGISQSHQGSRSIDGARHAAVSATYALARAVDGDAVNAAAYAAYSAIYAYGGYAVSDPASFDEAHQKQLDMLRAMRAAG